MTTTRRTTMPTEARAQPVHHEESPEVLGAQSSRGYPRLESDLPLLNPSPLTLCFSPEVELTDELFRKLCAANPELRLERTAEGDLEIMYPAGSESGERNSELNYQVRHWSKTAGRGLGFVFDSSAGFTLPNGAERSPDSSWIARDRWLALSPEQRQIFAPICPDFVAELRSPSDSKRKLRDKMREYIANGTRLGWLIDPLDGTVEVYRPGRETEILRKPERIDGGDVLPGFVLELRGILFE
jgi:Uma2 family endonuclease